MKYRLLDFLPFMFLFLSLVATASFSEEVNIVKLREPPAVAKAQYIKEVLTQTYALTGNKVRWINTLGAHELDLVNQDKLTAALARATVIEKEYPDLIRVPFKVLHFELLKVSDRQRCGYCLDEDISSIIYAKGSHISEQYAKTLRKSMDKLAILNPQKLNEMILKRRVDSALIMDFQLSEKADENPHLIIETVALEYDYHYLSPKQAHLKEPLLKAFNQLNDNGTLAKLQAKYEITERTIVAWDKRKKIKAISGNWIDYTNIDGSGVYWDIIDEVFNINFAVDKKSSIWSRALRAFENKQADVLVGAYRSEKLTNAIFSSYHIDYEYPLYAFMRDQDVLTRFKAKDKELTACLNIGSSLLSHVSFLPMDNIIETDLEHCYLLIDKGKVDVVVEYDYNLDEATQILPKLILVEYSPIYVVFHDTPEGNGLKKYFDERIKKLAGEGKLKALFPDNVSYKRAHIRQ